MGMVGTRYIRDHLVSWKGLYLPLSSYCPVIIFSNKAGMTASPVNGKSNTPIFRLPPPGVRTYYHKDLHLCIRNSSELIVLLSLNRC